MNRPLLERQRVNIANSLAKGPFFYGWYVVALACLSQLMAFSFVSYVNGVLLYPMVQDLGWSRGEYSGAVTLSLIVLGFAGFFIGGLVDRHGARRFMVAGACLAGCSLIGLTWVQTLWQFYILRSVVFVIGQVGFSHLVVNVAVSNWFVRYRGLALGIAAMGISAGGVVMVPITSILVTTVGWRMTWMSLGIIVLLLIVPTSALIMRRRPEDLGLLPDGASGATPADTELSSQRLGRRPVHQEEHWTRYEAIRTPALWLVAVACAINWGTGLGVVVHLIALADEYGFSSTAAAAALAMFGVGAAIIKTPLGIIMDRFGPRHIGVFSFLLGAVGLVLLIPAAASGIVILLFLTTLLIGIGMGVSVPLQEMFMASYYGRLHLGSVRAAAAPLTVILGAFGPLIAGIVYDSTGSYSAVFPVAGALMLIGAIFIALSRAPKKRLRRSTGI